MWKFGIIIFVIQSSNAIAGKSTNILFLNMIYYFTISNDHECMFILILYLKGKGAVMADFCILFKHAKVMRIEHA
jgi:hypothetical protein